MDSGSEGGSFWHKLTRFFSGKGAAHVEQAILEASQEGELEAAEGSMLINILHLDELQAQDVMTPRTDITGVEANDTIAQAIEVIVQSGHSRLPIYMDNRDNIAGIIYAKDLLKEALNPENHGRPVMQIMRQPFFVPETKNVLELLNELKAKKNHLAVVLDEYGGTSGLVTIEDIIEEIVGDIEDEHDAPREADIVLQKDKSAVISGRAYLEDINETLGTDLESDEVDTIGGLLSHIAGRLPEPGEEFSLDGYSFIIQESDNKQVYKVLAKPAEVPGEAESPAAIREPEAVPGH